VHGGNKTGWLVRARSLAGQAGPKRQAQERAVYQQPTLLSLTPRPHPSTSTPFTYRHHNTRDTPNEHAQYQRYIIANISSIVRCSACCCGPAVVVHMDSETSGSIPRCCCGSDDCVFLAHNQKQLDGLEHNVSKAAQLGQVRIFVFVLFLYLFLFVHHVPTLVVDLAATNPPPSLPHVGKA
jgi:hypothetical protein